MKHYDESEKLNLICIKSGNSIEFKASRNGNLIEGILIYGIHYNWIAFPTFFVSCQLADFSDKFWNREQLETIFENVFDVETILLAIDELKSLFDKDVQSYSDGYKFMSQREYIFWMENQCEILSVQMINLQTKLESLTDYELDEDLSNERNEYHNTMRFQYEGTAFE